MKIGMLGAALITPAAIIKPAETEPDAVLQGIAARDPARAKSYAQKHSIQQVFNTYDELVHSPEIDLVYNALPISQHAKWTIKALQAGKHVLCEKPLAMNAAEAEGMLAAAKSSGARLIEAFHYRYHPAFEIFLDWASNKSIGDIRSIRAHFNVGLVDDGNNIRFDPKLGGGAMMDLGCYPISWTLATMRSEPVECSAQAVLTAKGVDESMTAELRFASGAHAELSASMAENLPPSCEIHVVGERGEVHFNNPLAPQYGSTLTRTIDGQTGEATIDSSTTYANQLTAVIRALENGRPLPTEGDALLTQQRTLDAVYESAGLGHLRAM